MRAGNAFATDADKPLAREIEAGNKPQKGCFATT
jgi:hypothetical protein